MSWAVGYDTNWDRDIGYGVPSICDHPDCNEEIDRGLGYVCGGEPYGGDTGYGLYFCWLHVNYEQKCIRCQQEKEPFTPTLDTQEWISWKLTHDSWEDWRNENPEEVKLMQGEV